MEGIIRFLAHQGDYLLRILLAALCGWSSGTNGEPAENGRHPDPYGCRLAAALMVIVSKYGL